MDSIDGSIIHICLDALCRLRKKNKTGIVVHNIKVPETRKKDKRLLMIIVLCLDAHLNVHLNENVQAGEVKGCVLCFIPSRDTKLLDSIYYWSIFVFCLVGSDLHKRHTTT